MSGLESSDESNIVYIVCFESAVLQLKRQQVFSGSSVHVVSSISAVQLFFVIRLQLQQ